MTTELEEQFFKVFGIEPKMLCDCEFKNLYDYRIEYGQDVCIHTEDNIKEPCKICELAKQIHPFYPKITDRVLLELICIQGNIDYFMIDNSGNPISVNGLKKSVLHTLTLLSKNHKELKQQIQQLFKEVE